MHSCGAAMVTQIIGARRHIADVQLHACVIRLFKTLLEFITERPSQSQQHRLQLKLSRFTAFGSEFVTCFEDDIRRCTRH